MKEAKTKGINPTNEYVLGHYEQGYFDEVITSEKCMKVISFAGGFEEELIHHVPSTIYSGTVGDMKLKSFVLENEEDDLSKEEKEAWEKEKRKE